MTRYLWHILITAAWTLKETKQCKFYAIRVDPFMHVHTYDEKSILSWKNSSIIWHSWQTVVCITCIRPKNSLVSAFPTDPSKLMRKSIFFSFWASYRLMCSVGKKKIINHRPTESPTSCRKERNERFGMFCVNLFDRTSTSDSFLSCVHSLPIWFLSSVGDINMIIF